MTARELLHWIEFYEKDEWESEDYPNSLDSYQYDQRLYVPDVGEIVEFGWFMRDGERVEELSEEEQYTNSTETDIDYERSPEYRVVDVKTHYNRSKVRKDERRLMKNRIELTTEVIVVPCGKRDGEDVNPLRMPTSEGARQ